MSCTKEEIIRRVREAGVPCRIALDAEGAPLTLGIAEKPDFIKPNRHELELLVGRKLPTDADVADAAAQIVAGGVETVIVSMDSAGSMLTTAGRQVFADAVPVEVVTTVGAGDALVSGYLIAAAAGKDALEAFRCGVACAAARVAGRDGHMADYLPQVTLR